MIGIELMVILLRIFMLRTRRSVEKTLFVEMDNIERKMDSKLSTLFRVYLLQAALMAISKSITWPLHGNKVSFNRGRTAGITSYVA